MIKLTVKRTAEKEYMGFTCRGHAGYADYGQDIVCAGVSALVVSMIQSIDALTEDVITTSADEETGEVICSFAQPASKEATLLLDALLIGCRSIAAEYGDDYIEITFREV
ncbi:MAG: ribosomal-processing cysteine protease Prp [Lachnospiraceae bacterium]|mgnify:CR=1 FL=1